MQVEEAITKKFFKQHYLVLAHFFIFSLGLLKLTLSLSSALYEHIDMDNLLAGVNEWAECFSHEKLLALLHYTSSLIALFILYKLCFLVINRGKQPKAVGELLKNKLLMSLYLTLALALNLIALFSSAHVGALMGIWLVFFLALPFSYLREIMFSVKLSRQFYFILTILVVLQFFFIFKPFILNAMLIENDYFDIPEKTFWKEGGVINNSQYINNHKIGGLLLYDPRKNSGQTPSPRAATFIKVSINPLLNNFLRKHNVKYRYTYYANTNLLALNSEMTAEEKTELNGIYRQNSNKNAINFLYYSSLDQADFYKKRIYSPEEKEFIKKNLLELTNQAKAGWQLYHHNYILGPINALALGALPQNQTLLYGWLNTLSLMKIMKMMGDINYQTYFKLLFSFYPLYFVLFIATLLFIFKRIEYGLIGALLLSTSIFIIGDQLIRVAPGFNPIRHLFDVIIFLFFYLYLKKENPFYLACSILIGFFSILWSKDFGLFILFAIIGATTVKIILEKNKSYLNLLFISFTAVIGLLLYFLPYHGQNTAFKYMLLGFGMPGTATNIIIYSLIFVSVGYLIHLALMPLKDPIKFLSLALFFYCQLILVYFIWYPSLHHLLGIAAPFIFLSLTWLHLYNKVANNNDDKSARLFSTITLTILFFIYLPSLLYFYYGRMQYEKIFKTHVTYHWNTARTGFISTMEPDLFNQAVTLINKYEHHSTIYIISKYDAVLPILASKYSVFPFTDLPLNLISQKEINLVVDIIKHDSPEYLFIDSDITRNFNGEIFNINDVLGKKGHYQESFGRVSVMTNLRNVYSAISQQYRPIEKGYLITVYKKIPSAAKQ